MFCFNCGEKVNDNAKFCHACGTKLDFNQREYAIATVDRQEYVTEEEAVVKDEQNIMLFEQLDPIYMHMIVLNYLNKIFDSPGKYGEQVYLVGYDRISIALEKTILDSWLISKEDEPWIIFEYSENMKQGFIITAENFMWRYIGKEIKSVSLKEIRDVEMRKAGLANVIHLVTDKGEQKEDIYLTGMRNVHDFVADFREFIYQINIYSSAKKEEKIKQWEMIEERNRASIQESSDTDKLKNMTDFEKEICRVCTYYATTTKYCEVGEPLGRNSAKLAKAMVNFKIPANINVYLILDATVMGSCKEGFAICSDGVYYAMSKKNNFIGWERFGSLKISKGLTGTIKLGDISFVATGDSKQIYEVLIKIQKMIKGE